MKKIYCKFIMFALGILLFSVAIAAPQNSNEQSLVFQVNQEKLSINNLMIESASLVPFDEQTNEYSIQIKLKQDAASQLKDLSSRNIGKRMTLKLNGALVTSPVIQSALGAEFLLTGVSREQAEKFVQSVASSKGM